MPGRPAIRASQRNHDSPQMVPVELKMYHAPAVAERLPTQREGQVHREITSALQRRDRRGRYAIEHDGPLCINVKTRRNIIFAEEFKPASRAHGAAVSKTHDGPLHSNIKTSRSIHNITFAKEFKSASRAHGAVFNTHDGPLCTHVKTSRTITFAEKLKSFTYASNQYVCRAHNDPLCTTPTPKHGETLRSNHSGGTRWSSAHQLCTNHKTRLKNKNKKQET